MERPKILVIGSSNTDLVIQAQRFPKPGETVLGNHFFVAAGGKGANQAVASARLGGEVTFVACIGTDGYGDQAIERLKKEGIITEYIFRDSTIHSGIAVIVVDETGQNMIVVANGSNDQLKPEHASKIDHLIQQSDAVLLQLETPLETVGHVAKKAKEHGVDVILDPAPAKALSDALISLATYITPNESEVKALTGVSVMDYDSAAKAAKALKSRGAKNVIIKMGEKGCFLSTSDTEKPIQAPKVSAVDTVAAGDCFNGAFAVALKRNKSVEEAIAFANQAASISVTRKGAQQSIPFLREIE